MNENVQLLFSPVDIGMFDVLLAPTATEQDLVFLVSTLAEKAGYIARIIVSDEINASLHEAINRIASSAKIPLDRVGSIPLPAYGKSETHYPHKWAHYPDNVQAMIEGRFADVFPKYAEISITLTCNFGCHQCTSGTWKKQHEDDGHDDKIMTLENINKTVDFCADNGIQAILFAAGGEPTLNKNLLHALAYAKMRGLKVGLYSNGSFSYTNEQIAALFESVDLFRISLHAVTPREHADYHNIKSLTMVDRVRDNVARCAQINMRFGKSFGTNNVFNHRNHGTLRNITDFLCSTATKYPGGITFSQFCPEIKMRGTDKWGDEENHVVPQFEEDFYTKMEKEIEAYTRPLLEEIGVSVFSKDWDILSDAGHNYEKCLGTGWYLTEVDPTGKVYFCTQHSGNPDFYIGNIFTQSFGEIWNGERRLKLLNENRDFSKCPVHCKQKTLNKACSDVAQRVRTDQNNIHVINDWVDNVRKNTDKNEFI